MRTEQSPKIVIKIKEVKKEKNEAENVIKNLFERGKKMKGEKT